jgi:putative flavoprotein involved in K+ transport
LKADERVVITKRSVDAFIQQRGIGAPLEAPVRDQAPNEGTPKVLINQLNFRSADITTIIWATGYGLDFSWIKIPIFDDHGFPQHYRGVTAQAGLYFLGLPWLYRATSSGVIGVGDDAAFIAEHIGCSFL